MKSPCTRICQMESRSGLCLGCGRTLGEIAGWSGFGERERNAIMAALPQRMERLRQTGPSPETAPR